MDKLRIEGIERNRKTTVEVNGRQIEAWHGETLLAALIAAGIKTLRKSSVLKEPRGGLCGMGVCYDCLVTLNGVPNVKACMTIVEDSMVVKTDD